MSIEIKKTCTDTIETIHDGLQKTFPSLCSSSTFQHLSNTIQENSSSSYQQVSVSAQEVTERYITTRGKQSQQMLKFTLFPQRNKRCQSYQRYTAHLFVFTVQNIRHFSPCPFLVFSRYRTRHTIRTIGMSNKLVQTIFEGFLEHVFLITNSLEIHPMKAILVEQTV